MVRRVRRCLGHVSSGANTMGRRYQVLESLASSVTEGIFLRSVVHWLFNRLVLRTWVSLRGACLESRLRPNFRSETPLFSINISLYGVVQEESILIKVILGLVLADPDLGSHGPSRCLTNKQQMVRWECTRYHYLHFRT